VDGDQLRERVDQLNDEAESYRWVDYDRVKQFAEEAFELACQTDTSGQQYREGMATSLWVLADRDCAIGEWSKALSETAQGLALLDYDPMSPIAGWLCVTSGKTRYFLGQYVESLAEHTRALRIGRDSGDLRLEAYVLDRMASVYSATGDIDLSLETHRQSLDIYALTADRLGEALALNNMAYGYLYKGEFAAAMESAKRSLLMTEVLESNYLRLGALDTLAEVSLNMGLDGDAEWYSRKGLELAEEHGLELEAADALLSLARVEAARSDYDTAIENAERALAIDERFSRTWEASEVHLLLSDIHARAGGTARALQHFRRFHELESAMRSRDNEDNLARLRIEHQVESARQNAEIMRLRSIALKGEVEQANLELAEAEAQASLDPLTGLFNRRHLLILAEEVRRANAEGRPVALAMFDVDQFKVVNDTQGHTFGDTALVAVAAQLRRSSRKSDMPCRWGGDEFQPADISALIEAADTALYAAKRGGRDRACAYSGDDSPAV